MRRVPEVLDCWFESGSMPFAQVHYPFENARLVRAPLPGRLHRRVQRADPRLVLHDARAGHRAVRPAGVQHLHRARHRAGRRRAEDVQVAAQLPRRQRGLRPRRLRRDALVPDVLADPARRRPGRHRAGHPRGRPAGAVPLWNAWYFLTLYANAAQGGRGYEAQVSRDSTDVLDRYVLAKLDEFATEVGDELDVSTRRGLRRDPVVPGGADQLVHPPVPGTVLGRRSADVAGRLRHPAHGAGGLPGWWRRCCR